jgi:hypothetical protein
MNPACILPLPVFAMFEGRFLPRSAPNIALRMFKTSQCLAPHLRVALTHIVRARLLVHWWEQNQLQIQDSLPQAETIQRPAL